MAWERKSAPRNNVVVSRVSDDELAALDCLAGLGGRSAVIHRAIRELIHREAEAARRRERDLGR